MDFERTLKENKGAMGTDFVSSLRTHAYISILNPPRVQKNEPRRSFCVIYFVRFSAKNNLKWISVGAFIKHSILS